ncbi:hypothetical protein TUBRATIS_21410 [Tubulinosema ratisbonensis]|uniref:Uncharacterized protein n=1 Tax=Tubulinosema ratisbonensis TaxID=291195 RepID=A0A437AJW5_9MICR|nr:hypothetical protein TUBRATIS_21410 [Tubulinosema ratisbonensis]
MIKTFLIILNLIVSVISLYLLIDMKVSEGNLNLPQGMPQLKKKESLVPHRGIQEDESDGSENKKSKLVEYFEKNDMND